MSLIIGSGACAQRRQPTDSKEQIETGWENYRLGEFDRAIRDFELAASQTSGPSLEHLQALYGQATTWNLRRPKEHPGRAAAFYRQIITLAPQSDFAAWSWLALARMKHLVPVGQEPNYEEVRAAYQEVIDRFPSHLAGEEAFVYQQSTRLISSAADDARTALAALERFVETHSQSGFLSTAYGLMAQCHAVLGDPEKRLAAEIKALETAEVDPTNPFIEHAGTYWRRGMLRTEQFLAAMRARALTATGDEAASQWIKYRLLTASRQIWTEIGHARQMRLVEQGPQTGAVGPYEYREEVREKIRQRSAGTR